MIDAADLAAIRTLLVAARDFDDRISLLAALAALDALGDRLYAT